MSAVMPACSGSRCGLDEVPHLNDDPVHLRVLGREARSTPFFIWSATWSGFASALGVSQAFRSRRERPGGGTRKKGRSWRNCRVPPMSA
jgi:hypothetical protein